jgi:hypothetical protein
MDPPCLHEDEGLSKVLNHEAQIGKKLQRKLRQRGGKGARGVRGGDFGMRSVYIGQNCAKSVRSVRKVDALRVQAGNTLHHPRHLLPGDD